MYGIYANIWGILMVNVTIYSIHGCYGIICGVSQFQFQFWISGLEFPVSAVFSPRFLRKKSQASPGLAPGATSPTSWNCAGWFVLRCHRKGAIRWGSGWGMWTMENIWKNTAVAETSMLCVLFCFPIWPSLSRTFRDVAFFFRGIHVSEIHFRELSRKILKRIPYVPWQTHTETFVPHLPRESL